jgi:hypothetical protein
MRWRTRLLVAVLVALAAGCSSGDPVGTEPAARVVIVSLPGVSWDDVRSGSLPTLRQFAERAAIGNLATRVGRQSATTAAAYLTMGAGTRAVVPDDAAGVALEPNELYHLEPGGDVVGRRLGHEASGIAYLAIGAARDANESSAFGAEVATLGDELEAAGVHRAVIANADVREGRVDDDAYGRSAVAVLMGSDGLVDGGVVARRLLEDDVDAPFGVLVDRVVALRALDDALTEPRAAVLVEASDLERAAAYAQKTDPVRRRAMRTAALRAADNLLAGVLERVGDRDSVLVLSPRAPGGAPDLGVVALRTPDGERGLLRSATTRRDGYVQLADVAPTVLTVLGIDPPDDIEGRPFRIADAGERGLVGRLADAGELAEFRDAIVPVTVTALIVALAALCVLALLRRHLPARIAGAVPVVAAGMLGALPATFISAIVGVDDLARYVALLVAGGAVVAAASVLADRRWPGTMPIVSVGTVVALIGVDVLVGAPLQLNTVFGYSVAVAGRFAGVGNLAFALLGAGAVVLAALLAERFGARGLRAALVVLIAVLLVDGLPVLGADVGGVLSTVPAFTLAAVVLFGRRIDYRTVVVAMAAALVALVGVAFIDLARPAADQTHLARLAQHMLDRRWTPFFNSLARRWTASFGSGDTGAWVVLAILAGVVLAYLAQRAVSRSGRFRRRPSLDRPERAAAVGLSVLALLGLIANDSSFAVPFTMLLIVAPVVLQRLPSTESAA